MSKKHEWSPCPKGTLQDVRAKQKRDEQAPVVGRRAFLGVLITVGAAGVFFSRPAEPVQLVCSVAVQMMPDYLDGLLKHQQVVSLETHLGHCPSCRHKLKELEDIQAA